MDRMSGHRRRERTANPAWVADLGNLSVIDRLCRFVPAPVVEAIFSDRMAEMLGPHQQEVIVVFLDLRGFTAFVETTPPAEVGRVLDCLSPSRRPDGQSLRRNAGALHR